MTNTKLNFNQIRINNLKKFYYNKKIFDLLLKSNYVTKLFEKRNCNKKKL